MGQEIGCLLSLCTLEKRGEGAYLVRSFPQQGHSETRAPWRKNNVTQRCRLFPSNVLRGTDVYNTIKISHLLVTNFTNSASSFQNVNQKTLPHLFSSIRRRSGWYGSCTVFSATQGGSFLTSKIAPADKCGKVF